MSAATGIIEFVEFVNLTLNVFNIGDIVNYEVTVITCRLNFECSVIQYSSQDADLKGHVVNFRERHVSTLFGQQTSPHNYPAASEHILRREPSQEWKGHLPRQNNYADCNDDPSKYRAVKSEECPGCNEHLNDQYERWPN